MADGMLLLSWKSHHDTFCYIISKLREKENYTDVTLACEGKFYPVHKLVLSACSEYLEKVIENTPCKHPVIVLHGIKCSELEALLSYMYIGEVSVPQKSLSLLIQAAELLEVKGLAVPDRTSEDCKAVGGTEDHSNAPVKRRMCDDDNTSNHKRRPSPCNKNAKQTENLAATHNSDSQETADQVGGKRLISDRNSPIQIEAVFIEDKIKEEVVEDDNMNDISAPETFLDYQTQYEMDGSSIGHMSGNSCQQPAHEDYITQSAAAFQDGHSHQTLATDCTSDIQEWLPKDVLGGDVSSRESYPLVSMHESPHSLITQHEVGLQKSHVVKFQGSPSFTKSRGGYNRWTPEERLLIAKACIELGPSKAARVLSEKLKRKLSESTVRNMHKQYLQRKRIGQITDSPPSLPKARLGRPCVLDLEQSNFPR